MTDSNGQRHVYLRQIAQGERTSLSVLAGWVAPGSRVLDLGTGSGALGTWLTAERQCTVDGVTINPQEAELAGDGYRRVQVADLEAAEWPRHFAGERYDFIVLADVLEHLREPERTLERCRPLLAPGGQLLVSVPNAGYSGLIAELMAGELRYRPEGLLDQTHLRFFTRRSIGELLATHGYAVEETQSLPRALNESEFRARFDELPPAVARYLLALPDADTYQLLLRARGASAGERAGATQAMAPAEPPHALFTAQAYFDRGDGFREDQKIAAAGIVGRERQVLRFEIPAGTARLRLDPADRPGFLHLHAMRLLQDATPVWQWRHDAAGMQQLEACPHQQMLLDGNWPGISGLVLLHGEDPWLELPLQAQVLQAGGVLELEVGWPMSADYLALAGAVGPLVRRNEQLLDEAAQAARAREEARRVQEETQRSLNDEQRMHGEAKAALAQASEHLRQAEAMRTELQASLQARQAALEKTALEAQQAQAQLAQSRQRQADQNIEARKLTQEKLALQRDLATVQEQFQQLAQHLRWIENSTVFRATRPLVHAKMAIERMLGKRPPQAPALLAPEQPVQPPAAPVDVIVPVYRGIDDTRCCIESVLASTCETPWRLVVLNDASPEPEVTQWLRAVAARDQRIVLLENEQNLGFVGTVNRGMAQSGSNDVVLLNSDAEVANDWLDRLRAAAYRDARIASVTPFSNNATICSYPRFCEANDLPAGWDTARLDAAFASANAGEVLDVPTGVGFCMYIRRDCLHEVGLFDVEQFGKGYGEENDFCRRAADAGWRNLHALDTFVRHAGGVSFGESKSQREIEAVEKLRRLHPSYDRLVHDYVQADPPRAARLKADVARVAMTGLPVVLAVLHNRGGGTHRHAVELADHLREQAVFFALAPAAGGAVTLELLEPGASWRLQFELPQQWEALLDTLRSIGIAHVHYHHIIGHGELVLGLAKQLGVSFDYTTHDFFPMCPNISLTGADDRYCGEHGEGDCSRCASSAPGGDIGGWRRRHGELLLQARAVLAPSRDAGRRFARLWPGVPVRFAPHTDLPAPGTLPPPDVRPLGSAEPLRVAVLGAMSRIKGADVLEDAAVQASRAGAPVEFHLLGFAYRNLKTQPHAALTVHGAYQDDDLPRLLAWLKPHVVWFPAQWPETYSYTLSACLQAGLPVVAPDLGAFGERLSGRRWSWLAPWDATGKQWMEFFTRVREEHFLSGTGPRPVFRAVPEGEATIPPWEHATDYVRGLQVLPVAGLPLAALGSSHIAAPAATGEARGLKRLALSSLVRLRSSPGFRSVARAVPAHVQRRLKNWLLA